MSYDNGLPRCPHSGKVAWRTKADARAHYRQRRGENRRAMVFRCAVCEHYHVGHR